MTVTKNAKGGVYTSPTLGLVAEYAGAHTNPEVIAPQSILRETIAEGNQELASVWIQTTRQILAAIEEKDLSVAIGDDQIAQSANRGNNNYKKRTGKPLFSM